MKILFVLLLALGCYANPTGSELKKTPSTAFDFTMVPSNDIKETLQDMIMVEIGKELFLERRKNNLWQCQTDQFGTNYCPTGLAPAKPYTAYYQSTTYERESTVIDYQNGYSVSGLGQVVDYILKEKQYKCPSDNYLLASKYYDSCSWCNDITYYEVRCSTNGTLKVMHEFRYKGSYAYAGGRLVQNYNQSNINSNIGQTYLGNIGQGCNYLVYYSRTCDGINCNYNFSINSNCNGSSYSTSTVAPIPYIYSCPTGYSETTGSETSKGECKKTINYAFYTYTCPSGYTVANAGLTTCTKTDPDATKDSTSTLDDACNSATPPVGNCSKSISYKYYEYLCQAKNSFLEPIKNLNSGLKSPCAKSDPNNTIDNTGTLDDACNSSTPPVNNCQSTEYTCDSTLFKPVYVGGKWVCSPFMCDGNMKCGYGTCDLPTTPSTTKYQDIAYNPLGTVNDNKCNGDICDFVVNARVTYCESKQCPKGDDIIEKNGKCYKLECPAGTYLSGEKCIKVN